MAKKKQVAQDQDETVSQQGDFATGDVEEVGGSYTMGEISVDLGDSESSNEAEKEGENFSEYEEIDEVTAKKLLRERESKDEEEEDMPDDNTPEQFLQDVDYDPEEDAVKRYLD